MDVDLPSTAPILKESRAVAADIKIGRTAFMAEMGVDSELEYKARCIRDNKIMFHAHIGLSSWQATAGALVYLQDAARQCGHDCRPRRHLPGPAHGTAQSASGEYPV